MLSKMIIQVDSSELLALKGKISYPFGFDEFYEMLDLYLERKYHLVPVPPVSPVRGIHNFLATTFAR